MENSAVGPTPHAAMVLADLGAAVVRIRRWVLETILVVDSEGKHSYGGSKVVRAH